MVFQLLGIVVEEFLCLLETLVGEEVKTVLLHQLVLGFLVEHALESSVLVVYELPHFDLILLPQPPLLDVFLLE
jgi:hypothetical protein